MLVQEVKNRSVRFRASEAEEMNLKIEPFEWWGLFATQTSGLKKISLRILGLCVPGFKLRKEFEYF